MSGRAKIKARFIKIAEKKKWSKIAAIEYISEKLQYFSSMLAKPVIFIHFGSKSKPREICNYRVQSTRVPDQPSIGGEPCTL